MATIDRPTLVTSFGSGASIPGDAATGHVKRLIVDWVENLYPQETPILTMIGRGKELDQNKPEWGAGAELHHSATLLTTIASGDTSIVLNSGEGDRFQVGDTLALYELDANGVADDSTKEIVRITAIATDTLTVVRAQGGTSARAFTGGAEGVGAYIHNLGTAVVEGADFTTSPHVFGDFYYNHFQTFQRGHKISFEANEQPNWEFDRGNHIARLMTDATMRVKRQLNDALSRGGRQAGTTSVPSMLGGFPSFVPSANTTNLSGAVITPYDIEAEGAALWESVGDAAGKKLFMSMRSARYFDGILQKYKEAQMDTTSVNLTFNSFTTRFGQFTVEPIRGWPEGVIVGANVKNMTLHPYKGMNWQELEHPVHGAYIHRSVFGRFTLVVRSPETMFKIYGFNSDFNNYGRVI